MKLTKDAKSDSFQIASEGKHHAICVDFFDKGMVDHPTFGRRHRILMGWQIEERHEGWEERFVVWKEYTASLYKTANLRADLESWRGAPIADGEEIDLGGLIGTKATLVISHSRDGKYANVDKVLRPSKSNSMTIENYTRKHIRDAEKTPAGGNWTDEPDDDLPF